MIDKGYLDRENPTGYFGDETAAALCDRQVNQNITTADSNVCGLYGPATRTGMWGSNTVIAQTSIDTTTENLETSNSQLVTSSTLYTFGESGFHIIRLQQQLYNE
ncbi:MAG: hypothetical protein H6766_00965 [Candidatus Peribacteria bacterium]|nr:MAG: hypothetical protein H6766_00965 [Candidatus Peribacteria bacterium]